MAHTLHIALAAAVVAAGPAAQAGSAATGTVKNIVLVHGAGTDGSGWRGAHDILAKHGYRVSVVQQPLAPVVAAWRDKPTYGIVATADRALNPMLARWMYKRSGATTAEIKASHLVHTAHLGAVAGVIEKAARSISETKKPR